MPDVDKHVHRPPVIPGSKFVGDPGDPWEAIASLIQDGIVEPIDKLIQKLSPDPDYVLTASPFCKYFTFKGALPKGFRMRVEINGNEHPGPTYGAVEVYMTPVGAPLPPKGNPAPRTTFGGNGETAVNGPGVVTVHLKTKTLAPRIRAWIERIP
jgi:hypothetical protein